MTSTDSSTANWQVHFLGVGNAAAVELGSASILLERNGSPFLMVDCGQEALTAYGARHGAPPPALFITHCHLDHVAGFERLFVQNFFGSPPQPTRLFVPATLVPVLQDRIANYPDVVAEGGANFWDAFHLIPVDRGFWLQRQWFDVFPVRHHAPASAYGLCLPGSFLYTGDTRPIPEVLAQYAGNGVGGAMPLIHDCDLLGNPSHTGLPDLLREYDPATRQRMVVYHYGSAAAGQQLAAAGLTVASRGDTLPLPPPLEASAAHAAQLQRRLRPGTPGSQP
jgi:ribonuclease BN (tRNA processing enzyme)